MKIIINGEQVTTDNTKLTDLLQELKLDSSAIVIEKNGIILDKAKYQLEKVAEHDSFEFIRFMGGG